MFSMLLTWSSKGFLAKFFFNFSHTRNVKEAMLMKILSKECCLQTILRKLENKLLTSDELVNK